VNSTNGTFQSTAAGDSSGGFFLPIHLEKIRISQGFGKSSVCNPMKTVFKVCQETIPSRNAAPTHNP
jgi:hypothetical protein